MDDVELKLDDKGHGAFVISGNGKQIGEMEVELSNGILTVFHTGVIPEAEGKGIAKKLLSAMTNYARSHRLQVIPLCPYVHAQFKRHPDEYADLWRE
jgi:uncharacterized protein